MIDFCRRFKQEQIDRIKSISVFDVVVSGTRMLQEDIQVNPFKVPDQRKSFIGSELMIYINTTMNPNV